MHREPEVIILSSYCSGVQKEGIFLAFPKDCNVSIKKVPSVLYCVESHLQFRIMAAMSTSTATAIEQQTSVNLHNDTTTYTKDTYLPSDEDIKRSLNVYSYNFFLFLYDYWVLGIVTRFAWRCPVPTHILPFFRKHKGKTTHLDIGVGTGYYTRNADFDKSTIVTLMDLNEVCLTTAAKRFEAAHPREQTKLVRADAFQPLPAELGDFDAVSLFYFLHCLPGPMSVKCSIFANLAPRLRPGGCVYGATIVDDVEGVEHNWFGKKVLNRGNADGWFSNRGDSEHGLREGLGKYFDQMETEVVGTICLFRAWKPKTV